jgi:hypothetical protein
MLLQDPIAIGFAAELQDQAKQVVHQREVQMFAKKQFLAEDDHFLKLMAGRTQGL